MIGQLGFWVYLHRIMDESPLLFHEVDGQNVFPTYTDYGDISTKTSVLVIHKDGRAQPIQFSVNDYTTDEADRIMQEIEAEAAKGSQPIPIDPARVDKLDLSHWGKGPLKAEGE